VSSCADSWCQPTRRQLLLRELDFLREYPEPAARIGCFYSRRRNPATKHVRLAFWPVQREEVAFVRADLVSRDAFEHLADLFWSETLNNVKPAA
jgi:hypothetical protein